MATIEAAALCACESGTVALEDWLPSAGWSELRCAGGVAEPMGLHGIMHVGEVPAMTTPSCWELC